jgi:hypothetical protein
MGNWCGRRAIEPLPHKEVRLMGIGASIFLIAVGLILALAVDFDVSGLDIAVIGWILVAAGVVGLLVTMAVFGPRRTARRDTVVRDTTADGRVVEERRVDGEY